MTEEQKVNRTLTGRCVSAAMDKTITVVVERRVMHPIYGKFIKKSTRVHAHDEENSVNVGDTVTVQQCRPLSKSKKWRLHSIVERAK